jgi:hypothetical protein
MKSCKSPQIPCICVNIIHLFERFLTFDVLIQARPALRDRRKFFSTNNLRLVENFLDSINGALIVKNLKFIKSRILSHISIVWCQLYAHITRFWTFGVSVQAKGSLRDLRYFFSTNNLRLVKIFSRYHE